MAQLFEETTINGLTIKNRFIRSGTWDAMANADGTCTPKMLALLEQVAKGDVGLIITGFASVSKDSQTLPFELGVNDDGFVPGLMRLSGAVHQAGCSIVLQIYHSGIVSNGQLTGGQDALGPSVLTTEKGPLGKAMTMQQINDVVAAFGAAALRGKKAGFDGVEVHAAHGLLLDQFLSPFFNQRQDAYGGSLENRARLLLEVVHSVRDAVGKGFPLLVKLSAEDLLPGGFAVDDAVKVAKMLEQAGVDAIELSGGTFLSLMGGHIEASPVKVEGGKAYYEETARRCKAEISIPLMMVGGVRSVQEAQRLIDQGITDYVSLARPLIREPNLVKRWQSGDTRPSECLSDNLCLFEGMKGNSVHCVHLLP
jgi:2,4-dienoyl-CoA reductase-like NADH-dependent reductase (Old Yellow Enzyme family)